MNGRMLPSEGFTDSEIVSCRWKSWKSILVQRMDCLTLCCKLDKLLSVSCHDHWQWYMRICNVVVTTQVEIVCLTDSVKQCLK